MRLVVYRGKWAAEIRIHGQRKRLSTGYPAREEDREAAWAEARRLERELKAVAHETIGDMMTTYLAERQVIDRGRLVAAWKALRPHWHAMRPADVTRYTCREYAALRRDAGRSDGTIRKELCTLRAGINYVDPHNGAVWEMPPPPPPADKWLTREQARALLDAADETFHLKVFLHLALGTAARKEALFGLTWRQVRWDEDRIFLGFKPGGKPRATVPMTKTLRAVLSVAWELRTQDNYVIEWSGRPVRSVRTALARAATRAGLPWVTPHVLRHTAAVWMRQRGVPLAKIKEYLGHTSIGVTERTYAKYGPDYLDDARAALEI